MEHNAPREVKGSDPVVEILKEIEVEIRLAMGQHGSMASAHEGFAVILEEVDELKAEVWKNGKQRDAAKIRNEAIQVAAMGARFVLDVCDQVRPLPSLAEVHANGPKVFRNTEMQAARLDLAIMLALKGGATLRAENGRAFVGETEIDFEVYDVLNARGAFDMGPGSTVYEIVTRAIDDVHRYEPAEAGRWAAAFGVSVAECVNEPGKE